MFNTNFRFKEPWQEADDYIRETYEQDKECDSDDCDDNCDDDCCDCYCHDDGSHKQCNSVNCKECYDGDY